jgi:hypothetical protein
VAIGLPSDAGTAAPRTRPFRTFQVYPKDLQVLSGQPVRAVSWHSGSRGGAPCSTVIVTGTCLRANALHAATDAVLRFSVPTPKQS